MLYEVITRNNALYWVYEECKRSGYDPNMVVNTINGSLKKPLNEQEIKTILRLN